jgi:hypothetical protein
LVSLAQRRRLGRVLLSLFYKLDRIPSFDIRYSLFEIRFLKDSYSIKLADPATSGGAEDGASYKAS